MAQCCANVAFLGRDESPVVLIICTRAALRAFSNLAHAKRTLLAIKVLRFLRLL